MYFSPLSVGWTDDKIELPSSDSSFVRLVIVIKQILSYNVYLFQPDIMKVIFLSHQPLSLYHSFSVIG